MQTIRSCKRRLVWRARTRAWNCRLMYINEEGSFASKVLSFAFVPRISGISVWQTSCFSWWWENVGSKQPFLETGSEVKNA